MREPRQTKAKRKPALGKHLYWRGDTIWAQIRVKGTLRRESLQTSNPAQAVERLKRVREDAERERAGLEPAKLFDDAVVAWDDVGLGVKSENARRRYRTSLRMLDPHFEGVRLSDIDARTIGAFVQARRRKGASHATIRRDLTALSRLLSFTVTLGWRQDNPARTWDRSALPETRDPIQRPCMRSYEACVAIGHGHWPHLLRFLLASGFRLEVDATSLRREAVNWKTRIVTFRTKTGRLRTRELTPEAMDILGAIPAKAGNPFVFWQGDTGRMTNCSRTFEDIRQRAAERAAREGWEFRPFRLHDLRHEFAIRYLEAAVRGDGKAGSIYTLQRALGHTSVKTTEIYLDFLTDEEAAVAKGLMQAQDRERDAN